MSVPFASKKGPCTHHIEESHIIRQHTNHGVLRPSYDDGVCRLHAAAAVAPVIEQVVPAGSGAVLHPRRLARLFRVVVGGDVLWVAFKSTADDGRHLWPSCNYYIPMGVLTI
jgi:hypothetical protein